ncbi:MAG: hypothetical protein AAGI09_02275 [Pseudomonadota bacterium]
MAYLNAKPQSVRSVPTTPSDKAASADEVVKTPAGPGTMNYQLGFAAG